MSIEAMKQALEALETCDGGTSWADPYQRFDKELVGKAITAIKQAHAAPVQEPVAWAAMLGNYSHVSWGKDRPDYPIRYEVPLYTTPPAAPVQDDPDEQVIRERDEAEAIADALAEKIAAITGCEIGEHTSANSPWHSALDAADEFLASHPPAAQPEQKQDSTCNKTLRAEGKGYPRTCMKCGKGPCIADRVQPEQPEQPEQEPVAWLYRDSWGTLKLSQIMPPPIGAFPVYTTPPAAQRQWVGLTVEEIIDVIHPLVMADMPDEATDYEIARAIEAKLRRRTHDPRRHHPHCP